MRKKTKFNPELLKEELKKFNTINEYTFGIGEDEDLLLGNDYEISEVDEDPTDNNDVAPEPQPQGDNGLDGVADELGLDEPEMEEPEIEEPEMEEPVDDSVELDVTELVQGSEEAKEAADKATQNTEILLQKLTDLESKIANMDKITNKIDNLEKEIVERNPTPVEKLEMRSLSSFPYSQKLTDFWADKKGAYDVMDGDQKEEEYSLTQDDVDQSYSEGDIKKSFGINKSDDYEEEDF
jgi:hypothetical protein